MKKLILLATHIIALALGFGLGVYFLPILTAPASPDQAELEQMAQGATYTASFTRDLAGSDFLHWGEGDISVSPDRVVHRGALAPGPDYKMYLVRGFVEDEAGFLAVKDSAAQIGDVKSFGGVIVDVPQGIDIEDYDTVLIWCEAFNEFITAAKYR